MASAKRSFFRVLVGFILRSTVLHIITYFVIGALAFRFMTHRCDETAPGMRDVHGEFVMHWFFPAQVVRGVLFGFVLFPLRRTLLDIKHWGGFVVAGILFMIGWIIGINGVIEEWVYSTRFNPGLFLAHLPEVVIQTLLYGYLLLAWERRVERKHGLRQMPHHIEQATAWRMKSTMDLPAPVNETPPT
jgi:hypothetical protein